MYKFDSFFMYHLTYSTKAGKREHIVIINVFYISIFPQINCRHSFFQLWANVSLPCCFLNICLMFGFINNQHTLNVLYSIMMDVTHFIMYYSLWSPSQLL